MRSVHFYKRGRYDRRMRLRFAMMVTVSLGIACSSSNGGDGSPAASLDCAWLAGNNCWKSTISDAQSCLPPKDETGILSADMKSCTYASGAVVTFDQALVLPVPDEPMWNFTVTSAVTSHGRPPVADRASEDVAVPSYSLSRRSRTWML